MATHSNILAWEIPWSEELGRLQSIGLQRVRTHTHTHTHTPESSSVLHPFPSLHLSPTTNLIKYASENEKIRKISDR